MRGIIAAAGLKEDVSALTSSIEPGPGSAGRGLKDPPPSALQGKALERAYEHAVRLLDRDAEILDQLRTRASFLIAALAIGGAVLGAILSSSTHGAPPWWVIAPLGLAIVPCIGTLWPTRDRGVLQVWKWTPSGSAEAMESLTKPLANGRHFTERWREWGRARNFNLRLWKTGLGKDDFNRAQNYANQQLALLPQVGNDGQQTWIDQILVERMYVAHFRNDHTLTRRADLLRSATLLTLLFFILFSVWLPLS